MDQPLADLLETHKAYFEVTEEGKVKCLCNGHQFPARFDVIAPFIKGSKFATLRKRYDAEQGLKKYEPFIIQSKNFPLMLYCTLTGQLMDKSIAAVKIHMKGKRFQRNKELFAADKKELQPEPDIDTLMAEVMGRKASTKKTVESDGEDEGEAEEGEASDDMGTSGDEDDDMAVPGSSGDEEMEAAAAAVVPAVKAKGSNKAAKGKAKQPVKSAKKGKEADKGKDVQAAGVKRTRAGTQKARTVGKHVAGTTPAEAAPRVDAQLAEKQNGHAPPNGANDDDAPDFWVPEEFADIEPAVGDGDEAAKQRPEVIQNSKATQSKVKRRVKPTVPAPPAAKAAATTKKTLPAKKQEPAETPAPASKSARDLEAAKPSPRRNATRPSKAKKAKGG